MLTMVLVQPEFALVAEKGVDGHADRSEYLLLTGLPKRLVNFRIEHADAAGAIAEALVQRLDVCLHGQVTQLVEASVLYEFCVASEPDNPEDGQACQHPLAARRLAAFYEPPLVNADVSRL